MADTDTGSTETPAAAGSRSVLSLVGIIAVIVLLVGAVVAGGIVTYVKGRDAGACDKQIESIKEGYTAYLGAYQIRYDASFSRGDGCQDVFVALSNTTKRDGHTTTVTCPKTKIHLADKSHPTPYTKPVQCDVVDRSTIKVAVGQPVGGG